MDEFLDFKQMVVWDKGPIGMGWHYRRSYETVLVGQKRGGACKWYDKTDRVENIIRHIPKIIPQANDHPTPKPPELAGYFIRLHTQAGETGTGGLELWRLIFLPWNLSKINRRQNGVD